MFNKLQLFAFVAATTSVLAANSASASTEPYCREYTETFQIGGRTETGYGTACMQPDGSWQKQGEAQLESDYSVQYEQQKQNVVYVIDERPVVVHHTYPTYRPYYQRYSYASRPYNYFSLNIGDYGHHRKHYNRGHGRGHDRGNGWGNHGGGHGRGHH